MGKVTIDPMTRIEGHMKIEALVDGGQVKEARSAGALFRGFEVILRGRHPFDAARLTQRVCGVCPTSHGTAAALALDSVMGIDGKLPENGRIIRNLILACNFLQSHILHFYALAALDYVDVTAVADYEGDDADLNRIKSFLQRGVLAPFVPRFEGDYRLPKETNVKLAGHYVQALRVRRLCHEMLALWGGKAPHNIGVVPGGVTTEPTSDKSVRFLGMLGELEDFVNDIYLPDVLTVAKAYPDYFAIGKGVGRFLSYGAFDLVGGETDVARRQRFMVQGVAGNGEVADIDSGLISEVVTRSFYSDAGTAPPREAKTEPQPGKAAAYSWIKAPRYDGRPHEVGPLARTMVAYLRGVPAVKSCVDSILGEFDAEPSACVSVLGRHAARAVESKLLVQAMKEWVRQIKPKEPACASCAIPDEGEGAGLLEAPRGALGHWVCVAGGKIENYQLIVPTTWNAGPADDRDQPGPIEQALLGTAVKDEENPFELVRIVRSFDPCLACAVHVIDARARERAVVRIA